MVNGQKSTVRCAVDLNGLSGKTVGYGTVRYGHGRRINSDSLLYASLFYRVMSYRPILEHKMLKILSFLYINPRKTGGHRLNECLTPFIKLPDGNFENVLH